MIQLPVSVFGFKLIAGTPFSALLLPILPDFETKTDPMDIFLK